MEQYTKLSSIEKVSFWENHISDWKSSGLSQKQYSLQHDLKPKTFGQWKNKLSKSDSVKELTPISEMILSNFSSRESELEIIVDQKITIKIKNRESLTLLKQVLQMLEIISC